MWQVQVIHDAVPSVTFDIVRNFNAFLAAQHAQNPAFPGTLAELYTACKIKLVITDGNDPDGVGFVQWRIAFYVAGLPGECVNFTVNLLDNFFDHRKKTESERPFPALEATYIVTTSANCSVGTEDLEIPSTLRLSNNFT
eukprot:9193114-Lingulodinium_polyedra.AAC.1